MANPLFQCSVKNDEIWIKGISYETKANNDLKLLGIKMLRFEVIENGYAVTSCHVRMVLGWLKRFIDKRCKNRVETCFSLFW